MEFSLESWLGIGVDIIRVERVAKLSPAARARLFTEQELASAQGVPARQNERLAGRFAAKEAVLKALGVGLSQGIRWKDVEVSNGPLGEPRVELHGKAAEIAQLKGVSKIMLSISHDGGMAIAMIALT